MRKTRVVIFALLVVLCFGLALSACDDTDRVKRIRLTKELKQEIRTAHKAHNDCEYYFLGSINGKLIVIFKCDRPSFQVESMLTEIDGLPFDKAYPLSVVSEGKSYLLEDAYAQGVINKTELTEIAYAFWGTEDLEHFDENYRDLVHARYQLYWWLERRP